MFQTEIDSNTYQYLILNFFSSSSFLLGFKFYYLYSIIVWSAAPKTTLWGGPGPRFEPGPDGPEAGTLPLDHHTSKDLNFNYLKDAEKKFNLKLTFPNSI